MVADPETPKLSLRKVSAVTLSVPPKLVAPVVTVNPLEPVSNPFEVIVPPVVVWILPVVERFPLAVTVKVGVPLD